MIPLTDIASHRCMYIKDIIHNTIPISPVAKTIIDNPIFQRLRYLHQLGVLHFVFPSVNNMRFEHSIGTYHLAGELLESLNKNSNYIQINKSLVEIPFVKSYLLTKYSLSDTEENLDTLVNTPTSMLDNYIIELVKIAGLVHDLGHGPLSHTFDNWLENNESMANSPYLTHEMRSVKLFERIVDNDYITSHDGKIYGLNEFIIPDALEFISDLIHPDNNEDYNGNFLFQIISNSINGLDVDKLDYMSRDSFYLGLGKPPYDLSRIFCNAKIIDGNICFPSKMTYDILSIFITRYNLYRQFYHHKTAKCIELMVYELFDNLEPMLNIIKSFTDETMEDNLINFIGLTDSIIFDTVKICRMSGMFVMGENLLNAERVVQRINTRKLYKCIFRESYYTNENVGLASVIEKNHDLFKNYDGDKLAGVRIKIGLLGGNCSHPLDNTWFYHYKNPDVSFKTDKTKISHVMGTGDVFQETIYMVIYKD